MTEEFIAELHTALPNRKGGLEAQLLMAPSFREEELIKRDPEVTSKKSAVLVLLNPYSSKLSLIITKRSSKLNSHRGQVSFPGGKVDETDKNITETALRETDEEIGIQAKDIQVIGYLTKLYVPPSNFDITPVVAILKKAPDYAINDDEVESVVEVPIQDLLDNSNILEKPFFKTSSGIDRVAPYYDVMGLEIWGATAMIISEFIALIKNLNYPLKEGKKSET